MTLFWDSYIAHLITVSILHVSLVLPSLLLPSSAETRPITTVGLSPMIHRPVVTEREDRMAVPMATKSKRSLEGLASHRAPSGNLPFWDHIRGQAVSDVAQSLLFCCTGTVGVDSPFVGEANWAGGCSWLFHQPTNTNLYHISCMPRQHHPWPNTALYDAQARWGVDIR
jgi:hypothetical protein